jgi:hypothetical protein
LEQDAGTVAQIQQIINAANEFDAARAMCLLNLIEEDQEVAEFLPLGSSNHAPIHFDETEYFGVPTGVNMYPNPSEGLVQFVLENQDNGAIKVELYDIFGSLIMENTANNATTLQTDYSAMKAGTYLVKISVNNEYQETRLLLLK